MPVIPILDPDSDEAGDADDEEPRDSQQNARLGTVEGPERPGEPA